jgi:cytochrome c-type biogenesis protein CcmH
VRHAIAALDKPDGSPSTADAAPTPDASTEMTAEQREMARGMVERLAARLATDGSDVEGWLRLVRSYMVLGEHDKARAAASDARRALAGDPSKLQRLDTGVKALGVEG